MSATHPLCRDNWWLLDVDLCRGVEKVGVLGFCMGGALSAAAAVLVDEIDASVVFYGTPEREVAKMAGIFHTLMAGQRARHSTARRCITEQPGFDAGYVPALTCSSVLCTASP